MKMNPADKIYMMCEACQKPAANWGTVKLGTIDPTRTYTTSNKKIISNYKWRLCPKHFKEVVAVVKGAIEKL